MVDKTNCGGPADGEQSSSVKGRNKKGGKRGKGKQESCSQKQLQLQLGEATNTVREFPHSGKSRFPPECAKREEEEGESSRPLAALRKRRK